MPKPIKIKMADHAPKGGQPCERYTYQGVKHRAGEVREVSQSQALYLLEKKTADGHPLFSKFVEEPEKAPPKEDEDKGSGDSSSGGKGSGGKGGRKK